MPEASSGPWYWCLRHERVEPEDGCANAERLGPYPTREAAANWKATTEARNKEWDREDAEDE
ncbi:hypothetical protein K6U06_21120 [Acidiferrimicrobium sp. IK]|uniref:hypothetical protein n=1 Tax=Acidiferrimicrobium sp. IK TaxID=2871700 RepID=UPI0021CB69C8|nr:hypothetical protein [Acidiferrimicrobium sp. IK]MCU4186881.1 hypothetical protein [Acidiferrimicrobium sp. IK]